MSAPLENLHSPRVYPLRLKLETLAPFRLPEYKGALFRGGFGQFFRDLVCVTRMPVCTGCPHLAECPYSVVFETPVIPEKFQVLRKYPNAPHPFVLVPPLDARTALPAGVQMDLHLTLIGRGIDYLPHFIQVFDSMGKSGRYGGPFRLLGVISGLDERKLVYDGATRQFRAEPVVWQASEEASPVRRIRLEFLTPLRMRTEGRYNARPNFVTITQALLRRIDLLKKIYGNGNDDGVWIHYLLRQADACVTDRAELRLFKWDRMSGRQHRRVAMDGLLGSLTATGELTELAPFFRAGEWINVGSGTSMGMGRYVAQFEA
jgi:hypothetical protein